MCLEIDSLAPASVANELYGARWMTESGSLLSMVAPRFVACSSLPLAEEEKRDWMEILPHLVRAWFSSVSPQLICHIVDNFFWMEKLAGHIVGKS
jgi:hypothetical protein